MAANSTIILLAFDIPTEQMKDYLAFKKKIKEYGFQKLQHSIYYRVCKNGKTANMYLARIKRCAMPPGDLLLFTMSAVQFEKVQMYKDGVLEKKSFAWTPFEII